jgi:hypothetical protein
MRSPLLRPAPQPCQGHAPQPGRFPPNSHPSGPRDLCQTAPGRQCTGTHDIQWDHATQACTGPHDLCWVCTPKACHTSTPQACTISTGTVPLRTVQACMLFTGTTLLRTAMPVLHRPSQSLLGHAPQDYTGQHDLHWAAPLRSAKLRSHRHA